jgi:hypothetical protein
MGMRCWPFGRNFPAHGKTDQNCTLFGKRLALLC